MRASVSNEPAHATNMEDIGKEPLQRRMTSETQSSWSTNATDFVSFAALSKDKQEKPIPKSSSDLLMRMIAQEMLNSLMATANEEVSADEVDDDVSTGDMTFGSSGSKIDIQAIADMVLNSVDHKTGSIKPDQELRRLLKEGLFDEDAHSTPTVGLSSKRSSQSSSDIDACTKDSVSMAASKASKMGSSRSGSTESNMSDLSLQPAVEKNNKETPIDIWHPNFWKQESTTTGNESTTKAENSSAPTGTPAGSVTVESMDDSLLQKGPTIQEFLRKMVEISSDSDNSDTDSVLSDISGLTGVFTDFPEGRPTKSKKKKFSEKKNVASKPATPAIVTPQKKKERTISYSVRFKEVNVREYERILGDNPACTNGPSLSIGWNFVALESTTLDDWEYERSRFRRPSELMIDRRQREKLLRSLGYSEKDLAGAVRELNKIRSQRRQTVNNLGVSKMEEAVENARKKVKKILFLQRKRDVETGY